MTTAIQRVQYATYLLMGINFWIKGTTNNDLGGWRKSRIKNSKALLQGKKIKRLPWKKIEFQKASPRKKNLKGLPEEKKNFKDISP